MKGSLTIDVVGDIRTLVTLEPAWWSLWHRARTATPFQSPAWMIPWWRAFGPGELFVVVVWHSARLLGIVPLYIEAGPEMRLLPLGISISDYLDVLVDAAWEREVLDAVAGFLATCPTAWDAWHMPELPPDALALRLPCPPGFDESLLPSTSCPVLMLPAEVEALAATIPARKRRDIRMARHRAERRGGMTVARVDAASASTVVEDLFRLHEARWRSRGEPGLLADPRLRRFHREAVPKLVQQGVARLYTLAHDGEIVGIYYGLAHGDRAYAYLCGFDPAEDYESPGTILMAHAVEEAVREGAREFHFLRGQERYKYRWGAIDRWNQHRAIVRRAFRAHAS